jgi:hypothetical protein
MKNKKKFLLLGISISLVATIVTYNSNYSFASNSDARFQVIDCTIQGNSTFQKSGPCPSSGGELNQGSTITEPQNNFGSGIESGTTPPSLVASNPFASIS